MSQRNGPFRSPAAVALAALSSAAVVLAVTGQGVAGATPSEPATATGATLTVGVAGGLLNPDPQTSNDESDVLILEQIYQTLTTVDPKTGAIVGQLATSWNTSSDGLTWTFHLRHGVTFQNGDPFTSADVVYSLDRIVNPATHATLGSDLSDIKSATANGTYSVVVHLAHPFSILPVELSNPVWAAMIAKGSASTLRTAPDGTGPFEYVSSKPNASVTFKANPHYWVPGEPKVSSLVYDVIPDETALVAALESKQIDIASDVPLAEARALIANPNIHVVKYLSAWVNEFFVNTQRAPFNKLQARQAVAMAINKKDVNAAATYGLGKPAATMVVASAFKINAKPLPFNLTKAKQLLAQAGYPHGFSFSFAPCGGTAFPDMERAGEVISSDLKAIGVNATLVSQDADTWDEDTNVTHNYQAGICGLVTGTDPDEKTYRYFTVGGSYNFSQYVNNTVSHQLVEAREVTNFAQRLRLYDESWQTILDQAPWVPLYEVPGLMATLPTVHGFQTDANSDLILQGVSMGG